MELLVVEMLKFGFRFAAMKIWPRVTLIQNHKNYHFELEVSFTNSYPKFETQPFLSGGAREQHIIVFLEPGAVTDLAMIWNNELSGYELQWTNPIRSNARITGYHVIVHYSYPAHAKSTSGSKSAIGEETVYLSSQESNSFSLLEACSNIFDSVNVTIAAYGTGDESSMIPGKPTDYQFDCADMMIVGLSIGILIAIGLLAGKLSLFSIRSPTVDQSHL